MPSLQVGKCQADAAYRSVRLGGPRPSRLGGAAAGRGEQAAPGAGGWRKSSEGPRPDHGPLGFVTRLCLLHRPPPREDRQWQARGERLQVPPEASQPLGHGSEGQDPQCSEPWAPSGARALQTEAQGPARCAPHRRRAVGSPQLGAPASTPGSWCSADKGGVGGVLSLWTTRRLHWGASSWAPGSELAPLPSPSPPALPLPCSGSGPVTGHCAFSKRLSRRK